MSALTFTLREALPFPLDLAGLLPSTLAGQSARAIARQHLGGDGRAPRIGEVFAVSGSEATELRFEGLTTRCHGLGAGLDGGSIVATGNVGAELGRGMRAGSLRLKGSAGVAAGTGMRGGHLHIGGDAGARLGGVSGGAVHGMRGGLLTVAGNVDVNAGERLRRGLVIVAGDAADGAGQRMLAGTLVVLGQCGAAAGLGNRRATLMLASAPASLPLTYNDCGEFEFGLHALLVRYVAGFDRGLARRLSPFARIHRWCGDMAYGGKGELLLAAA